MRVMVAKRVGAERHRRQDQGQEALVTGGRQPAQIGRKKQDQHDAQPEVGHGHAYQRHEHGAGVEKGVLLGGGDNAQRDAKDHRQENGRARQTHRGREAREYLVCHRALGGIGRTHIALHQVHHIADITDQEGVVQPQLLGDLLIGLLGIVVSQHRLYRIAGRKAHDGEDDKRHAQQHRYCHKETFQNEFQHNSSPGCSLSTGSFCRIWSPGAGDQIRIWISIRLSQPGWCRRCSGSCPDRA